MGLSVNGKYIAEIAGVMTNPMTTAEDLVVGGVDGAPARLPVGSEGQVLKVVSGAVDWAADAAGMTNPMTTAEDLIIGGADGAPARLPAGSEGEVLKIVSGAIEWAADAGGMANPMTTAGDLIVGGESGTPTRVGVGSEMDILQLVGGIPTWTPATPAPSVPWTAVMSPATLVTAGDTPTALIELGTFAAPSAITYRFTITALYRDLSEAVAWNILATLVDDGVGGVVLQGTPSVQSTDGATALVLAVTIATGNLTVTVTGEAATTIDWRATGSFDYTPVGA